jgi:hypothetical protein
VHDKLLKPPTTILNNHVYVPSSTAPDIFGNFHTPSRASLSLGFFYTFHTLVTEHCEGYDKNGCIKKNSLVLIRSRSNYNHYGLTGTLELLKAMYKNVTIILNYYKTQGRPCRNLSTNLRKPVRVDETKLEVQINIRRWMVAIQNQE